MANQIQATVYQIDGNPLTAPLVVSFLTSDILIRENSISTIPIVASSITIYPNSSNLLQEQTFFVSESISTLLAAANTNGTTLIQATILEINGDPQVPSGVQYCFPANAGSIWASVNAITGVNSFLTFKNKNYSASETEATLVAAANAIADNPNNPCYLEIASNGAFPYTKLEDYNTNTTWATPFTALVPIGLNIQRLYGGSGVNLALIFQSNIDVTSINDGCGVITGIDDYAFADCTSLKFVNFPSVTNIPIQPFRQSNGVEIALFPNAVTVGDQAFYNTIISDISLPLVTTLGENVFTGIAELKTVYLPKLTSVPISTFGGCAALINANIPSAISIDNGGFANCTSLISVIAPKVINIGDQAFAACTSLTTLNFPQLESANAAAFENCTSLIIFTAPKLNYIGSLCFSTCVNLITVIAPNLNHIGPSAFTNCNLLNNIDFPLVTIIENGAFAVCYELTAVSFPIANIVGSSVFYYCTALTSINLPTITNLGGTPGDDGVFQYIAGLAINLTVPVAMKTINSGSPDGDIVYLDSNNTLTVNYI